MMDASHEEAVVDIYKNLLASDKRDAADAVATLARLLAPNLRLSPNRPDGVPATDNTDLDFARLDDETLVSATAQWEDQLYKDFCRKAGVEGYS